MKARVGLADPPWLPLSWSVKGMGRAPQAYYDGLTIEQMCALPVKDLFAADAALFMWVLDAFLLPNKRYNSLGCYAVFEAWGFEYSGIAFHWVKTGARLARQEPLFIVADNRTIRAGSGLRLAKAPRSACWACVGNSAATAKTCRRCCLPRAPSTAKSRSSNMRRSSG
jgi:N6-adenosine-specific RNA methylase IME4